jgi:hypothetical protein
MRRTLMAALGGLLMAWTLVGAAPAGAADPLGTATARNQVLRPGCYAYPFTYRVTPPRYTTTWSAEIFLIGPRGGKVGSAAFLSPADARSGTSAWRLCRASTIAGKYTMRMKVTFIDSYDLHTASVRPTTFRLSRR